MHFSQGLSIIHFFTLLFRRNNSVQFNGYELPRDIELTIFTDWWLGSKEEWRSKVDKLAANNIVEPIEPVVSYELTSIMWMEDSWVVEEFNSNHISSDWSVVCEDGEFYVRTP